MDDRGNMEAVQLGQLVQPVPGPRFVSRREPLVLPDGDPPKLFVIVTPPEVRARWLRWVAVRDSIVLTVLITLALIAAMHVI